MEVTRYIIDYFARWTKLKIMMHVAPDSSLYFYEREIWWISLGANVGYEEDGKHDLYERPVLVLRKFNKYVFWALPLTSKQRIGKFYVSTEYEGKKFNIILSQLRLLSSKRLLRKIRTLPEEEFVKVKEQVKSLL